MREFPLDAAHPRLHELLDRWESAQSEGKDVSADELCSEDPALAAALHSYIVALQRIDPLVGDSGFEPEVPTQIGPYRVIRELARGGTSAVYVCQQQHPPRAVALKLLQTASASAKHRCRFQLEIELLATLSHPGIAQIFQSGSVDLGIGPQPYFTMELVHGQRLDAFLLSRRALDWSNADTLRLFLKICDAVQHAHDSGVVHRDLKPGNILVDRAGQPKLIDLGIAKFDAPNQVRPIDASATVAMVGTPPYMSPEQFAEDSRLVDARSDVYSLAVVLYEALSGHLPYRVQGKPLVEVARMIRDIDPLPLTGVDRRFHRDLETVLLTALAKEPGERYQSVQAFADDLLRVLRIQPIRACRTGPFGQLWRWCRRNPGTAVASIAAVVLLSVTSMAATAFALTATRQARNLREATRHLEIQRGRTVAQANLIQRRNADLGLANAELHATVTRLQHAAMNAALMRAAALATEDHAQSRSLLMDESLCPSVLRGFAWHLLEQQTRRLSAQFSAHHGPVAAQGFSGDGRVLATVGPQKVHLWRTEDATLLQTLQDRLGSGSQVAVDATGDRVVILRNDGSAYVWRIPQRDKVPLRFPQDGPATAIACSVDGRFVALGDSAGQVALWAMADLKTVGFQRKVSESAIIGMRFHAALPLLAAISESGALTLFDVQSGELMDVQRLPELKFQRAGYSPELRCAALAGAFDNLILWDRETQQVVQTLGGAGPFPAALAIGRERPEWITARRTRVEKWSDGERAALLHSGKAMVRSLATDHDQLTVAVGCDDGSVSLYRMESPAPHRTIRSTAGVVTQLRFSPDGKRLSLACGDGNVLVCGTGGEDPRVYLSGHQPPIRDLVFTADGEHVITTDRARGPRVWHTQTGELIREFESPGERLRGLAKSGETLVAAGSRGHLLVYTLSDGRLQRRIAAHAQPGSAITASFKGDLLATGDQSGTVTVWDAASFEPLVSKRLHASRITGLTFSHDGRSLITADNQGGINVWHSASLEPITNLRLHAAGAMAFDLSPDGKVLATGGHDGQLTLWDAVTWEPQLTRSSEIGRIRTVRFSPDGTHLAGGGSSGTVVIWGGQSGGG